MCTQRTLRSAWVSDQTGWMPRLIWVFARCTCHFVGFVTIWLVYGMMEQRCGPRLFLMAPLTTQSPLKLFNTNPTPFYHFQNDSVTSTIQDSSGNKLSSWPVPSNIKHLSPKQRYCTRTWLGCHNHRWEYKPRSLTKKKNNHSTTSIKQAPVFSKRFGIIPLPLA